MKEDKERRKSLFADLGDFALDVAKLVIGGVLLAGIMKEDVNGYILYGLGIVFVLVLMIVGFSLRWISKSKD